MLADILRRLAAEGYREVSPVHLRMEMALHMDAQAEKISSTDIPIWQQGEWVGRVMRELGAVDYHARGDRPRVQGTRYQVRTYPLREEFIKEALGEAPIPEPLSGLSFCDTSAQACFRCHYRPAGCPITVHRLDLDDAGTGTNARRRPN